MSEHEIDISGSLNWEEGLPRPQWDLIQTWVESRCAPEAQHGAWVAIARQWMAELAAALDDGYETVESDFFLVLAPREDALGPPLIRFAEQCRRALLSNLSGVTRFDAPGKQVVVALRGTDDYYRYIAPFYPEGEHGTSAGIHLRDEYPHVALHGKQLWSHENTLANELTNV
jgi:hypothetical protein